MDWDKFLEFERFCFEYDIGIDQEDYVHGWALLKDNCFWPLSEDCSISFDDLDTRLGELETRLPESRDWNQECKRLILVKRARAVLQKTNSTDELKNLDLLAEYLIAHLATVPDFRRTLFEHHSTFNEHSQSLLLRAFFLNEISSCYIGYLSIGYATQCLELIKSSLGKGHAVQELIAQYNQALGYFHIGDPERARREFQVVVAALSDSTSGGYFYTNSHNRRIGQVSIHNRHLVKRLVLIPSQLQQVECLIKMQRSRDARTLLEEISAQDQSDYAQTKARLLRSWTLVEERETKLELIEQVKEIEKHSAKYANLHNNSLNLTVALSHLRVNLELDEWRSTTPSSDLTESDLSVDLSQAFRDHMGRYNDISHLLRRQIKNTQEAEQVVRLWVTGLVDIRHWCDCLMQLRSHSDPTQHEGDTYHTLKSSPHCASFGLVAKYLELNDGEKPLHNRVMTGKPSSAEGGFQTQREYLEHLEDLSDRLPRLSPMFRPLWDLELKALESVLARDITNWPRWLLRKYEARRCHLRMLVSGDRSMASETERLTAEVRHFIKQQFIDKPTRRVGSPTCDPCMNCTTYRCLERKCRELLASGLRMNPECDAIAKANAVSQHYYDRVINHNWDNLWGTLERKAKHPIKSSVGLAILRRWNSFTPALALSEGGGYFLFRTDCEGRIDAGVVVDPGYDFLRNFFAAGYGIKDISVVLVSHDHPDHLEDFSAIVTLKRELLNRGRSRYDDQGADHTRGMTAVLSQGAYKRLSYHIESTHEVFRDTIVIDGKGRDRWFDFDGFRIKPKDVLHRGVDPDFDSVGFIIEPIQNRSTAVQWAVGFPGDTKWNQEVVDCFSDCSVLCYHAGSITDRDRSVLEYLDDDVSTRVLSSKNHLYLPGTLAFSLLAASPSRPLCILSEFGEELKGGLRVDYVGKLSDFVTTHLGSAGQVSIIPSDTGLVIDVPTKRVVCSCCGHLCDARFMGFEAYGPAERLFAVCENCQRLLSLDQRQHIYQVQSEEGHLNA